MVGGRQPGTQVVKQVKLESCPREVNLGKYANKAGGSRRYGWIGGSAAGLDESV